MKINDIVNEASFKFSPEDFKDTEKYSVPFEDMTRFAQFLARQMEIMGVSKEMAEKLYNAAESGNDRIKVWFNGVANTSGIYNSTPPSTLPTWSNNLLIAAYNTSTLYPINGNIGPTQIYNRALSSTEVLHNYNALKGRFGL